MWSLSLIMLIGITGTATASTVASDAGIPDAAIIGGICAAIPETGCQGGHDLVGVLAITWCSEATETQAQPSPLARCCGELNVYALCLLAVLVGVGVAWRGVFLEQG